MKKMNSPISWPGGKSNLKRYLVRRFPEHEVYAETFFGAGHCFFWKKKSKAEWINDTNDLLITLWKALKYAEYHEDFIKFLTLHPKSRALFNDYKAILCDPEKYRKLPIAQRAAMAYYIIKTAFGTIKVFTGDETWGFYPTLRGIDSFYNTDWEGIFSRMKNVNIENRDFRDFMRLFRDVGSEKNKTFMYLDPPYMCLDRSETRLMYKDNFTLDDHKELSELLAEMPCKWMLSIDDVPEAREFYKDFGIHEVHTVYTAKIHGDSARKIQELMIVNYELPNVPKTMDLFIEDQHTPA